MKDCVLVALCQFLFLSVSGQSSDSFHDPYLENLFETSVLFDTTRQVSDVIEPATAVPEWKQWRTVENHFYGKNRGSLPMIADLRALHPYFRDKVEELIRRCNKVGISLAVVETYRTPSKQAEYFAMGKKYTKTTGGKSRHQYGLAVDVVPIINSVAVWNNHKLWNKIGIIGERLGLRWGGRWRILYDPGHFEWVGGVSRHELVKGILPEIPNSLSHRYFRIEEELSNLQLNWGAWEVEQSKKLDYTAPEKEQTSVGAGN